MSCSPTINFRCRTNSTISPVTHRTQLFHHMTTHVHNLEGFHHMTTHVHNLEGFHHMTTHVHNLEGYYRLRVQFSCHKDFRDLTETLTGSPVNVWPRDIFTYFFDLRLWYHLLERYGIRLGNLYSCASVSTGLRSNGVHNNKNIGLTQPKRLCSPTINFRCGTNATISLVTDRTQLFHHMTTHVHNLEGYYRRRVQFSRHKDFRDLTDTLTRLPRQRVTQRYFYIFFRSAREFIPMCRCLNRSRSNGVHNNKNMGLTQPKRLAWWLRTATTFMLCSPTINFRCETNSTKRFIPETSWQTRTQLI
jgi:hypothetical protein